MALELPKKPEEPRTEGEIPALRELSEKEKEVVALAREILAGNKRALENLLPDETLEVGFRDRKAEELEEIQRKTLRIIEILRDATPDNYEIKKVA